MPERIFVGVAWPTPNGSLHLGHVAGCYLPADIFARYHRFAGNEVLMVSGSDQHGTPVTVRADAEGVAPEVIARRYHDEFLRCWQRLGISFDRYTTTGTHNHARVVHDVFRRLWRRGYLREDRMIVAHCSNCERFLPDRYVEGACPHCGSPSARGDQCDRCGRPLDPADLGAPRCRRCGGPAALRERQHVFLRLSALAGDLAGWATWQNHWRPNVRGVTNAWLAEGLRDRAITRDLSWGIAVPTVGPGDPASEALGGYEDRRIYVWFEAVIGYLSATIEWAAQRGEPDAWRVFWQEPTRHYYFVGKDNIFFHTIVWPAILLGHGDLKLPDDVPANEFLTLEGRPFSTSRGWAVWLPEYLAHYDPDPLRFFLATTMPETSDADFSWDEFVRRNDGELVATWGNLAHRLLTFTHRHFGARVPEPADLRADDRALLARADEALVREGTLLAARRFRDAIQEALALAREANRYLDAQAPWRTLSTDSAATATTLYTALQVVDALKLLFAPFLPFSSERLHRQLGHQDALADQGWRLRPLPVGQRLQQPAVLFRKLAGSDAPTLGPDRGRC